MSKFHTRSTNGRRLLTFVLALVMVLAMGVPAMAADNEVTTGGGTATSSVELTAAAANFKVTVPSSLPVDVAADGEVTVATNAKVVNDSNGPIVVTDVETTAVSPWSLVAFTTDFETVAVGAKQIGMTINDADVTTADVEDTFSVINGQNEEAFTYDANVAIQSAATNATVAHVVFTVEWSAAASTLPANHPSTLKVSALLTNLDWSAADGSGFVTLDYMNGTQIPGENTVKVSQNSTMQDVLDQFSDTNNSKMVYGAWASVLTYDNGTGEYKLPSTAAESFYFQQHSKDAATKTTLGDLVAAANSISSGSGDSGASTPAAIARAASYAANSTADVLKFGTLYMGETAVEIPSNPVYNGGNVYGYSSSADASYSDITYKGQTPTIGDTVEGKEIQWYKVSDSLYICDRNLVNYISWDKLNELGYVSGTNITIDGVTFRLRLLTGGTSESDTDNEWDNYIANATDTSNNMWHWSNCYSWCQDVSALYASCRAVRGYGSVSYWSSYNSDFGSRSYGWRPALEIVG